MCPGDPGVRRNVIVGTVLKAVGLKGELKIKPLTDNPGRYIVGGRLWLEGEDGLSPFTITSVREYKGNLTVSLEGIESVDEAGRYGGRDVFVPESEVPPLPEGEFYHYQVLGLPVYTYKGRLLGKVTDIITAGEKDVYVVGGGGEEYLIPVTDDAVDEIDVKNGKILLRRMEGYIPE